MRLHVGLLLLAALLATVLPRQGGAAPQAAIVGGSVAKQQRYPWVVSLRRNIAGKPHFCGGTLISARIVLSAAHCFWDKGQGRWQDATFTKPQVRIGGWELNGPGFEVRQAVMAALPARYNPGTGEYDVALLLLDKPASRRPVRLHPATPNPKRTWPQGVPLYALGWGTLWWGGPQPRYLQEVRLDYLSTATCKKLLPRQDWDGNTSICAGLPARGKDTCSGDSGGPLFLRGSSDSSDVQVGIVSWGVQCGKQGLPSAYSNVADLRAYIAAASSQLLKRAAARAGPTAAATAAAAAAERPDVLFIDTAQFS